MNMARLHTIAIVLAAAWTAIVCAWPQPVSPTPAEMAKPGNGRRSFDDAAQAKGAEPFFSFTYDGKPSAELLGKVERKQTSSPTRRPTHRANTTWTDPKTGLEVRCVSVVYSDFPVVEWTVYFKNTGKADTPILADIQGMDVSFHRDGEGGYIAAQHARRRLFGRQLSADRDPTSAKETTHRFAPAGGRPTKGTATPYFNVEWPGQGVIAVLGWPGQWAAQFACDKSSRVDDSRRAGTDETEAASRRGDSHAAFGADVLERRRRPLAKPLAAVDDRP